MNAMTSEEESINYISRLSLLLLNDGTDVIRWFLNEHVPANPNLEILTFKQVVAQNQTLLQQMRDGIDGRQFINDEIFDIVLHGDESNLDISTLFTLIRFICKIKRPLWKWWDQVPQHHHQSPLYDVIRLVRFKEEMKNLVSTLHMTSETFQQQWKMLTDLLDRLNGYKLSLRCWIDDVMKSHDVSITCHNLIQVMRWQTMTLTKRNKIYLREKKTLFHQHRDLSEADLDAFYSRFGQKRSFLKTFQNVPKPTTCIDEVSSSNKNNNKKIEMNIGLDSLAHHADAEATFKSRWTGIFLKELFGEGRDDGDELTKMDAETRNLILQSVQRSNDSVFFSENAYSLEHELELKLREKYLTNYNQIKLLVTNPPTHIPMSNVRVKLARVNFLPPPSENKPDIPDFLLTDENLDLKSMILSPLTFWWRAFEENKINRILLSASSSFGKTTLLHKICHAWANKSLPQLRHIRYVIYLDGGLMADDRPYMRICDHVLQQGYFSPRSSGNVKITAETLERVFEKEDGGNCLFLIDNLEQIPTLNQSDDVIAVLRGEKWSRAHIVVTTCSIMTSSTLLNQSDQIGNHCAVSRRLGAKLRTFYDVTRWSLFLVNGFDGDDVIMNARDLGAAGSWEEVVGDLRKFATDCCVESTQTPLMTYLMTSLFRSFRIGGGGGGRELPTRLSDVMKEFHGKIYSNKKNDADRNFISDVLTRVLNGEYGRSYPKHERTFMTSQMLERGIIKSCGGGGGERVKFEHFLFEDYLASVVASVEGEAKLKELLQDHVISLDDVARMRYFLLFCSTHYPQSIINEVISLINDDDDDDDCEEVLKENARHLCFRCVTESRCETEALSELLHPATSAQDLHHRADGRVLHLPDASRLSYATQRALYDVTQRWNPSITSRGLPRLVWGRCWIRELRIGTCLGKQLPFIGSLIRELSGLEVAEVNSVRHASQCHLESFCHELRCTNATGINLHKLRLKFEAENSSVTSLTCLDETCREQLIYLDELDIDLSSLPLLRSLIDPETSTEAILPVTKLKVAGFNMNDEDLDNLTRSLHRFTFIVELDLSETILNDRLVEMVEDFPLFRNLQILNLSRTCLLNPSSIALCRSLVHPNIYQTLRVLKLRNNQLCNTRVIRRLVEAVKPLTELVELELSGNVIGDELGCLLLKNLEDKKNLQVLKLQMTELGHSSLFAAKYHLRENTRLHTLDLGSNFFGSSVLEFLKVFHPIPARHHTKSYKGGLSNLKNLNLSGLNENVHNEITTDQIDHFVNSISAQGKIETLSLLFTRLSKKADLLNMLSACERHPSLNKIRLTKEFTPMPPSSSCWTRLELC